MRQTKKKAHDVAFLVRLSVCSGGSDRVLRYFCRYFSGGTFVDVFSCKRLQGYTAAGLLATVWCCLVRSY